MEKNLEAIFPIMGVENDCILSKTGDVTIAYELQLPEIFTLSDNDYEAFHQSWIKAVKVLPRHSVFHKQDWFTQKNYKASFEGAPKSFLSRSSELFFHERPYLDHHCYLFLTKKSSAKRKNNSLFNGLLKTSIVPSELIKPGALQEFFDSAGQMERILTDSGFVSLKRIKDSQLTGDKKNIGLIERYLVLQTNDQPCLKDISFTNGIEIGNAQGQLYSLADVADLPSLCGSRINWDSYSTDRTKFSIGFAAPLGQLLSCNHIYNQYIFIDDAHLTIKKLESKRLRLQSLSAYSRENAISKESTDAFLNEAITQQRLPIKAHYNIFMWTEDKNEALGLKNLVSSALARMDAVPRQEVVGAPQIFWAGLPGNEGDFPMNETFDSFAEQATCFFNLETAYRSSISPIGIRLGDRLTGKPLHVDISDEPMQSGLITNRNKFILGPSGSGKSFFTNHMVRSYYEQGTHIVLVDVGHSYKGLCQLVNGYYFTYDEKNPIRFNPFFIEEGNNYVPGNSTTIKLPLRRTLQRSVILLSKCGSLS